MTCCPRHDRTLSHLVLCLLLPWMQCGPRPDSASVRTVEVASGVFLEVVDWGGEGMPLVFLSGLGHTAHVFDELAPGFTDRYHTLGITRRGFGASSQPDSGYDLRTLANDIRIVLDSLRLERLVLAGHSLGGDEMTQVARLCPERLAGLIYIEAAYSRVSARDSLAMYSAPESIQPGLSDSDNASAEAFRDYYRRVNGVTMPLSEIRALNTWDEQGKRRGPVTPGWIYGRILGHLADPDYSGIDVPVLALYATNYPVTELFIDYASRDPETQQAMRTYHAAALRIDAYSREEVRRRLPRATVVEVDGAGHSLYITHTAAVISHMRRFLETIQ